LEIVNMRTLITGNLARRLAAVVLFTAAMFIPFDLHAGEPSADGKRPQRVLIVTGEDYKGHRWQKTAPLLKVMIRQDPRLTVDVIEDVNFLRDQRLNEYDVIVAHFKNYDPNVPGRAGYDNLAEFVERGGGLVLVHFACGAFQEFKGDFVKLAGRVWNPKFRGHDRYGEFKVEMTEENHPITRGLDAFKTTDELYTCLDGATPTTVLAQARSVVDKKLYPMAFVLNYGKGRVFHTPLGHDAAALAAPGTAELIRRGTAWTAGLDPAVEAAASTSPSEPEAWKFVSMPDFLNVDTLYPQPGWEPALDYILKSVKAENPDFLLVAGDLVMGRWPSEADIDKYAAIYYPAWIDRMKAHGLKYYTAIGDHEVGDNPWPEGKARLVPRFKAKFREYLKMPLNGPDHMKGTAFWWKHRGVLFISVDVFEEGDGGRQGKINAQVTGEQLAWMEHVLKTNRDAEHIIVMGHTPILGPVRKWSSSGLMLAGDHKSPLWQTMKKYGVDVYLCGEVHEITCTERDGIMQIAHGGLIGYNTRTNYLVGHVFKDRVELELKEIDITREGEKLWQVGQNRPRKTVTISDEIKKRGFVSVGRIVVDKSTGKKTFRGASGHFEKRQDPKRAVSYRRALRDHNAAPPREDRAVSHLLLPLANGEPR
jgi:type 1 glutamine amidotransferase